MPARIYLPAKQSKYRAKSVVADGRRHASQHEHKRYWELTQLAKAGKISDLRFQVPISIDIFGVHVCVYKADFVYIENGKAVYEDAKGMRTKEYKLKKKLVWACHGISVQEI